MSLTTDLCHQSLCFVVCILVFKDPTNVYFRIVVELQQQTKCRSSVPSSILLKLVIVGYEVLVLFDEVFQNFITLFCNTCVEYGNLRWRTALLSLPDNRELGSQLV